MPSCPRCGSSHVIKNGHIHNGKPKFDPTFSPDGNYILYVKAMTLLLNIRAYELHIIAVDGSVECCLTRSSHANGRYGLAWAPSPGARFAYSMDDCPKAT